MFHTSISLASPIAMNWVPNTRPAMILGSRHPGFLGAFLKVTMNASDE
jgi:hypothetical protein